MPLALIAAAIASSQVPQVARAAPPLQAEEQLLRHEIAEDIGSDLRPFYASRSYRPLWIGADGRFDPTVDALLRRLDTSELDALKKRKFKSSSLRKALRRAESGKPEDLARAEAKLSETFVRYVQAMRDAPRAEMIYESEALAPVVPVGSVALAAAASEKSLAKYVERMGWMHPLYAPMRDALLDRRLSGRQRSLVWENLGRIRALPAMPADRYILVDAVTARLWMYEDGKPVDSMRVVVGKAETQTPMMAGFVRFAILNPYWNVPPGLVQHTIAANVLDKGIGYLKAGGYQVLSDWSDKPALVDPKTVDWHAVAAGSRQVRVRQLPGGSNFMGKVKFEFPNPEGIYLHDTPNKELMREEARQLSNGCVRLEDADRLGRWLMGKKLPRKVASPEQRVELPQMVPIYITYLTAMPDKNGRIAFHGDVYGRDGLPRIARSD